MGATVDISRLRTNLWDEVSVHHVHWDSSRGPVRALSLDSLRIRWTGCPLWSNRPAAISLHGLDLQLPAQAAQEAPNADPGGEHGDLRRWVPDLTLIEDVRIAVGDSSSVVAQLAGVFSARRSLEDALPAAPTRIDFATDGATLRLPYGSRHWDTSIAGDLLVGGAWLELDGSLRTPAHHVIVEAHLGAGDDRTAWKSEAPEAPPLFGVQAWIGLTREALVDIDRLDSLVSLSELRLELTARGRDVASIVADVGVDAHDVILSGFPVGQLVTRAHTTGDGDLSLDQLTLSGPTGTVSVSGEANWLPPYPVDLQIDATALDLAALASRAAGDSSLRGHADLHLRVRGDLIDPTVVSARAQGRQIHMGSLDLGDPAMLVDYQRPAVQAALETQFGTLRVDGQVQGAEAHQLTWSLPDLSLAALDRLGGIEAITGTGQIEVRSSGAIDRPQIKARARLDDIRLGALRLPPLSLAATIDSTGPVRIEAAAGNLAVEAIGDWPGRQLSRATMRLHGATLGDWLAQPWAQQWAGQLHLDMRASGDLQQPRIDGRIGIAALGLRGRTFGDIDWSMSLKDGAADVHVAAFDSTVRLSGNLRLDEGLPFQFTGQLADMQLRPFLELLTDRSTEYAGHVRTAVHVQGSVADLNRTRITLALDELAVSSLAGALALEGHSRATWQDGTLRLDSLRLAGSAGTMVVTGSATRAGPLALQYRLQRLSLPYVASFLDVDTRDVVGDLSGFLRVTGTLAEPEIEGGIGVDSLRLGPTQVGQLTARFSSARGRGRLDRLQLRLPEGGSLLGSAAFPVDLGTRRRTDRSVHAEVRLDSVVLGREQGLPGDVVVTLGGQINARSSDLRADGLEVVLQAEKLGVRTGQYIAENQDPLHLTWNRGHLRSSRSYFVVADTLPPADGSVARRDSVVLHGDSDSAEGLIVATDHMDLGVLARMLGVVRPVRGVGSAQAQWRGAWPEARIGVRVDMEKGLVDSVQIKALHIEGFYDTAGLRLDTLDAQASGGTVRGAGFFTKDSLRIAADVRNFELAPLQHSIAHTGAAVAGRLQGHVRLSGPRDSPIWEMQAAIVDGSLDVPSFEPVLRFASAQVLLTPDTLLITGLEDRNGHWSLEAHAQIDSGRATQFSAGMQLNGLRVEVPGAMELTVDGSLLWEGEPDSSQVTGSIRIDPARVVGRMSLRALAFADSAADALADVAASDSSSSAAMRAVRLAIDLNGRRMLLDNELARVPFDAQLVIGGTAHQPTIRGGLWASEGILFYMGQEFALSRTSFEFEDARPLDNVYMLFHDPVRLDPAVDLAASTVLKAKNGNEYDIRLVLGGTLADLQVALTSDPAENRLDILSLLNFGRTGVPMVDARGDKLSTGMNLSPDYLLSVSESQFGRVLGLDNVEIDNSVLKPGRLAGSRIVLTKQVGKRTEMIYSTTVGYASRGRVQLQYDLGRHMYLQTEHDARGESGIDLNLKLTFK